MPLSMSDILLVSKDTILNHRICAECFQLDLALKFNKEKGEIELQPSPTEFVDQMIEMTNEVV